MKGGYAVERQNRLPILTDNGRRLIRKLADLPPVWLTAAALGESIGVSRRTVMREMPGMEKWLEAAGFRFVRSPGQGVRLDEDEERRAVLRTLLDGSSTVLSKNERIDRLLALLFAAGEPVKTQWLAEKLDISEHTLANDLNAAGEWLLARGVTVKRRTGVGVWLEGTPENLRRAMGIRMRPQLTQLDWGQFIESQPDGSTLGLLDRKDMQAIARVLQGFERSGRFVFSDSAFISLVLHLTLLAGQIRSGRLKADGPRGKAGRDAAALQISLEGALGMRLPAGEAAYLDHYLHAALGEQDWDDPEELRVSQLAALLIRGMERETGVELTGFSTFRTDLCAHLRPMLLRMERGERIENPQLEAVRTQYAELWAAVRRVCDQTSHTLRIPPIPDEEAGFLAMHFGAVLEKCAQTRRRLRAVVVCPMGMATSRFLTSQLDREFPDIAVERMCPLRGLDTDALRGEGIGLIISTVPLSADFPHVVVSAVLQEKDRILLQSAVETFREQASAAVQPMPQPADLRYADALSACLVGLLDTMAIDDIPAPRTRGEVLHAAARLFSRSPQQLREIETALARREALGDTYIPPLRAHLLHCKTSAVDSCCLGYLRLPYPVTENGREILGAVVMLAPDRPEPVWQRVMQEVSAVLIDRPALIESLRAGERDQAVRLLETDLSLRFRRELAGE